MPNPEPPDSAPPLDPALVAIVVEVAGAPPGWARHVTPDARLDGDLLLDEVELAVLAERLRERFGPAVDLAGLRAGLGLAALEALTVADLQRLLPEEGAR
ncbi:hypothetical protein BX285_7177 [Streptomyces sp. 1114.5]|uniref:hypothetical protein n=1 Tax=unclassified Streptomyces TaxID=2593676 RepID=UPI000BD82F33|nr:MULTISPECIES: hypothetical protein [unclassified Streptomyces]RKT08810.1 hypothetical protein BX285_7177 [Streptomyces sp. 1114.5]SOB79099.1 hypothetical protein SAMN06272789_0255 [Streptomyces sp. 1331.2]